MKKVTFPEFKPMSGNFEVLNDQTPITPEKGVYYPFSNGGKSNFIPLTFTLVQRNQTVEPLTMLVNPKDFSVSMSKVNSSEFSRRGWITEQWGNNLDEISCSGISGGFYTKEFGLTRHFMQNSMAYQYIMSLFLIYQNNGIDYTNAFEIETFARSSQMTPEDMRNKIQNNVQGKSTINSSVVSKTYPRPHTIGHIHLLFDDYNYYGSFRDFKLSESAESPFLIAYSFSFVVRGENPKLFEGHYYTGE